MDASELKLTGVVESAKIGDWYWFVRNTTINHEAYVGVSNDVDMLNARRIFHDEASAQEYFDNAKKLETCRSKDGYAEVNVRELLVALEAIHVDVADVIHGRAYIVDLPIKSINRILESTIEKLSSLIDTNK